MADVSFTPEQIEKLLAYAGQRLGTTPDRLKEAFQKEGLAGLTGLTDKAAHSHTLTPEETAKAQAVLQDKTKMEALLKDPAVQKLLSQLMG